MLKHALSGDFGENFTRKTRGLKPRRNNAQNFTGHRRLYNGNAVLEQGCLVDLGEKGWEAAMPLSHLKLFQLSAILFLLAAVGWAADPLSGDSKVKLEPRSKTQATANIVNQRANIRVDSTLVLIPVTVTDPFNRFVTGLEKDNFKILEDKKEQEIVSFTSEDAPLSIGVVFDCSGSMGNKLEKSRQAVTQFFKTANPEDEFFLVEFNDGADLVQPFTTNLEEIQNRLTFTQSKGRTALLDAINLALNEMRKARNPRKALLVISDGGDNSSRYTEGEIKNRVKEADVQIYTIGIYEPIGSRSRTPEELAGPGLLTELAEQTGARQYAVENLNELPDIAAKIGVELRNQYILGYTPQNQEHDGKYRRVQVKLNQPRGLPPLRAFWRMGYYAPSE
jgi:Ca-activated chloride channel homolog